MQLETEQDMEDWLNKITYGNINQTMVKEIQKKCIGDEVIPIIDKKYKNQLTPPKNNSQTVKDELNQITEMVSSLSDESNKEHLRRYLRYDKQLLQVILATFIEMGMDVTEVVRSINNDINPTIIKLKQMYQRPRPYQLAEYYKLKLFPFASYSAHSPSYPSGHTLQAYCILNVIGNKFPKTFSFCKKMIDDVAYSRVYLGQHFPSDNDASYLIGSEILKLKEFSTKYEI